MSLNLNDDLFKACLFALQHNLNLLADEKALVVTDAKNRIIGNAFKDAALTFSSQIEMMEIPELEFSGQEPPSSVADAMLKADVILLPLAKSLSWTNARRVASEKGARIVSMPGITPEIVLRTFTHDYSLIKKRVNILCDNLDKTESVHITTEKGTDLAFSAAGRRGRGRRGGIYTEKGAWGNLPCGEAFIAPVEGTAQGVYVVDGSHSGLGKIMDPILIEVQEGKAICVSGGSQSARLLELLRRVNNPDAFNIAEFGIGCNDKAQVCGVTLEDEKSLGTCHIALGNNAFFGGQVNVGIHLDGVVLNPSVKLDNTTVIKNGSLMI
jgi:leucyl aminopeptidase (aminopeptidase T)